MFAQTYQSGTISLLYSVGNKPLQLWEKREELPARSVTRVLDDAVQSAVIELSARESVANTWIRCPPDAGDHDQDDNITDGYDTADGGSSGDRASLHIRLRHLVLLVKPLEDREMSLEVVVRDARRQLRRFRASTFQRATMVHPRMTLLPLRLDAGSWNQVQLDLAQLMRDAYGAAFDHAVSVQLHANCRVRRVYFAERVLAEEQLPVEFRLYKRLSKTQAAAYKALDKSNAEEVEGGGAAE